jgi:hypothetical protein
VLDENWEAVHVFLLCTQGWAVSLAGAHALGLSALEVDAACRLRRVPMKQRPTVSEQVMEMGRVAAEELNRRT